MRDKKADRRLAQARREYKKVWDKREDTPKERETDGGIQWEDVKKEVEPKKPAPGNEEPFQK